MEERMANEMETGGIQGVKELNLSYHKRVCVVLNSVSTIVT